MTITTLRKDINETGYPTTVQASLPSNALFSRYDPSGRFIAAGQYNGCTVIWDLVTRALIRTLDGHVKPVSSLDWSYNSRYVLTSSRDWNIIIWDLASTLHPPQRMKTIRFDAPVVSGYFHPYNSKIILALLSNGEAFLLDTREGQEYRTELWEKVEEPAPITVVRFHPHGKLVFAGTTNGHVLVFNTRTKMMIARHKLSGTHTIKHLEFWKSGRRLVTNSTDRMIRQFILPSYSYVLPDEDAYVEQELEPIHKCNDPINKMSWNGVALSPDGRWIAGGAADAMGHKIYIWDIAADGRYTSTLDGGRETLSSLQWHPLLSAISSTTREGNILLWHVPRQENFAAFAGGFEEIEENVVYEEREDEFDIEDEDTVARRKELEEDVYVNIDAETETELERRRKELELDSLPERDTELEWAVAGGDDDELGRSAWNGEIREYDL